MGGVLGIILPVTYAVVFRLGIIARQRSQLVLIALAISIVAFVANNITDDTLLQRYQGETMGTLQGTKEKDLSVLTTGRWDIFHSDLEIWSNNPIMGTGPGGSPIERGSFSQRGQIAHVEVSRLLSEHGVFGFIIAVLFLFTPLFMLARIQSPIQRLWMIAFCTIAIFTSFHSAMRTMLTPFCYGVAFLQILPHAYPVFRQQAISPR